MNIGGHPWHGDVFKIIPAIHDFIPVMDFVTIVGSGNPQALAWYRPRSNFRATHNNLESISRMTFLDIKPHLCVFNLVEEADAMERHQRAFLS